MMSIKRFLISVGLVIATIGASLLFMGAHVTNQGVTEGPEHDQSGDLDRIFEVPRGDFTSSVILPGSLDALRRHSMICPPGRRGLEIIELVKDRSEVKKGDVIVKFSKGKYEEELNAARLELDEMKKNLELTNRDVEMVQTRLITNIKNAVDAVKATKRAISRYRDQETLQSLKSFRRKVARAEEALAGQESKLSDAEEALTSARTLDSAKLSALSDAIKNAKNRVENADLQVQSVKNAFRNFRQYTHPQRLRDLKKAEERAKMALQQHLVTAEAQTMQLQRKIKSHHLQLQTKTEHIAWLEAAISELTLTAPADGIVILGNQQSSYRAKEIAVGVQLNQGEVVATISELSGFLVRFSIPEEYRSLIRSEMVASLTCKPLPDLKISGKVTEIAPMAMRKIRWDANSTKVYPAKIETNHHDARLTPGMTVDIEIAVDKVTAALYLPVEAVYMQSGRNYCRVRSQETYVEREIATGRSSDSFVEVLDGLKEGDDVQLFSTLPEG